MKSSKDVTRIHKSTTKVGDVAVTTAIEVETTECARLAAVSDHSQRIGEFLHWLQANRTPALTLCAVSEDSEDDRYYPARVRIETLLAEYFKIDLNKVERERRALLEGIRR